MLGACEDFAVMAGSTATCAGAPTCDIVGGLLGTYPGTAMTGNFAGVLTNELARPPDGSGCAADSLAAWKAGRAMTTEDGTTMLAEMGGVTFLPGVHIHGSSINIALTNPIVYLDARGDSSAEFIFNIGTTLTTCANSEIVLLNGAKSDNVFWILGTALTMGAESTLVGNVLAGSAITFGTMGNLLGGAIARTAVTCETACTVETSGRHSHAPSDAPSDAPSGSPTTVSPTASPEDDALFNFDGLRAWEYVPRNYLGFPLNWQNFYVMPRDYWGYYSGYYYGTTSGRNCVYNGWGSDTHIKSDGKFTIKSVQATSAWYDGNFLYVRGYKRGTNGYDMVATKIVMLQTSGPKFIEFGPDFTDLQLVSFSTSDWYMALDDFLISF
jgi:hypothetical protein